MAVQNLNMCWNSPFVPKLPPMTQNLCMHTKTLLYRIYTIKMLNPDIFLDDSFIPHKTQIPARTPLHNGFDPTANYCLFVVFSYNQVDWGLFHMMTFLTPVWENYLCTIICNICESRQDTYLHGSHIIAHSCFSPHNQAILI